MREREAFVVPRRLLQSQQSIPNLIQYRIEKTHSRFERNYIESDESDEDLKKPAFGEAASKRKTWNKENLCSKEPETFGANVITSMGFKQNTVDKSTGTESLASNRASSSFTCVQDTSKNFETKQKEVDEIDSRGMNGKRERANERQGNRQKSAECEAKTNDRSPSKFKENWSNQNTEMSWARQDDTTVKQTEKERTMPGQLIKKEEEEEFDSSIEAEIKKSKKHAKKALIRDLEDEEEEEEEDSRYQVPTFGIEVGDDMEVGTDDDLTTTG